MIIIKLMPDYECYPLWEASPGDIGNIDPADLPITLNLQTNLLKWAEEYDSTLNWDDPASSGFPSQEAEEDFKRTGYKLAEQLREELGPSYQVILQVE